MRFYSVLRLTLAVVVGVILGATLFHSRPVQAQSENLVEVREMTIGGVTGTSHLLSGSQVVGFSCVVASIQHEPPRCFTAVLRPKGN
jgi:hypothetical protein